MNAREEIIVSYLSRFEEDEFFAVELASSCCQTDQVDAPPAPTINIGLSIGLTIVGGCLLLKRVEFRKAIQGWFYRFKSEYEIPCSKCRFHNQNSIRKCILHPHKVLTHRAANCSDYWANESDRFNR